jgi:DNA-binding transcriptional ArsR family regulator
MSTTESPRTTESGAETSIAEPTGSLSRDDVFELLSNQRRRYMLHHLKQQDEAVELGPLSEHVAAWENETAVEEISSSERKRVYTSLQQFHLPKLEDLGVVEFDQREGTVHLSERAGDLDIYLEVVEGDDIPWSQYYLGLGAVNLALLTAALVNAYPFALIPIGGWAVFSVTTVLISAIAHTYISHSEMRLGRNDRPPELED